MPTIDKLKQTSYRGINFFYKSGSEAGGFKVAEHVYPGSDNYNIEQLGLIPKKFNISAQVRFDDRDSFDSALNTEGVGILIHPMYGNISVKVIEYSKDDSIDNLGLYDYSITFGKQQGLITPQVESASLSQVNVKREITIDSANVFIENALSILESNTLVGLNRNIVLVGLRDSINILIRQIKLSVLRVVNEDNNELNEVISNIQANIISIISTNIVNTAFIDLFESLDLVGMNPRDRYNISRNLFGFGNDFTQIGSNPQLVAANEIIIISARLLNLSLAFDNSAAITYSNQQDLNDVLTDLESEYQEILDKDLLDSDSRIALIDLRVATIQYLSTIDLKDIESFTTTQVPSLVLSYRLYGDSSLSDDIVELNNSYNTGFIEGTIKVLGA